ncbi:MAG: M20/M25/M40 family metallo-hydrolase [Chloroflexi bacterium]|nr:M20/M25/M40 family metallo-hydrolase [Chloroflexota bacterium]
MARFADPVEQQIAEALEAQKADLVAFCRHLIQTPSVNGVNDEVHLAEVIANEAQRLGLSAQIIGEQPQRPNVIVSTSGSGETGLLLIGHLDTVPPGDAANWTHPPFSGEIAEGRIYGRGAIDTKGGMAAAIYALAAVKDQLPAGRRAQFIGVPDEETGATGMLGIKYLGAHGLLQGKGAIYAYSGSEIILGHRGLLRYRLTCTGQALHTGSFEWQEQTAGANAVTGMARLLVALEKINAGFIHSSAPYFERFRTVMTPGTMISGGVSVNIVPDRCEALIDVRTTPENDASVIERLIDEASAQIATPALHFQRERLNFIPAACSDEHASIFAILADLIPQVRGIPAVKTVAGPANEGYLLIEQGIPTVCGFGPTGENAHAANEYADIDGLSQAALIFALTALRMAE